MAYNFILSTGLIEPDTGSTKTDVQAEYLAVFGNDLLLDDSTPQGRLIDVETSARDAVLRSMADIANQINPNIATGVFLQSIASLHKLVPTVGTYSTVNLQLSGLSGTVIAAGSRVSTTNGIVFQTNTQVIIGVSGDVFVDSTAQEIGPQPAPIGAINTILDGVLGWDSVTNLAAAVEGVNQETDTQLRIRRTQMLSLWSAATVEAIYARVGSVAGVNSLVVRDNQVGAPTIIDGVSLSLSSTWCCVDGGLDDDIATALMYAKQSGSPWTHGVNNGIPVTAQVTNVYSGQIYDVLFTRMEPIQVLVNVVASKGSYTGDVQIGCVDGILAYANDGVGGLAMGVDVSPFELSGAINILHPGIFVKSVTISYGPPAAPVFSTNELPIELWERAIIQSGNIVVTVV